MQKNLKGGYKLISLALIDIELALVGTGATIDGIHESIEASYGKSLQLTGIVVDGVEKNDVRVAVEVVDGDYVIKDVYGYDLTIDADDLVVATEHQSGGSVTRQAIVNATGLVTPLEPPVEGTHELVGIDDANAQEKIKIGDGLEVENGELKVKISDELPTIQLSTSGTPDIKAKHIIDFIKERCNLDEIFNKNFIVYLNGVAQYSSKSGIYIIHATNNSVGTEIALSFSGYQINGNNLITLKTYTDDEDLIFTTKE